MTNCIQCGKKIKSIGAVENLHSAVSLFICLDEECPNFCLAQVGLSKVEG